MIITYQEKNYFRIQSGEVSFLIDPTNQRSFKGSALVINTMRPSYVEYDGKSECFWINHQGEYEVQGIHIKGWSVGSDEGVEKTIYRIDFDDVTISVLGHITQEPPKDFLEHLEHTDVLIVPAGGSPLVSQKIIAKFVRQLEPGVIIPSLFKDIKPFLSEFGKTPVPSEEKFVFKKKDITPNAMEIRCLEEKK